MIAQVFFLPIAVVIMAVRIWRKGSSKPGTMTGQALELRRIAALMLWLNAAFWAVMGIGEMVGGDPSGAFHLLPAVLSALLTWMALRRPQDGAWVLTALGLVSFAWYQMPRSEADLRMSAVILLSVPYLIPGLLLWIGSSQQRT